MKANLGASLVTLLLFGVHGTASAGPTYTDGLGRQWLDVNDTTNFSWNDMAAICPTDGATPCSGSLGATDLTGWTWATRDQVREVVREITGLTSELDNYYYYPLVRETAWASAFLDNFPATEVRDSCRVVSGLMTNSDDQYPAYGRYLMLGRCDATSSIRSDFIDIGQGEDSVNRKDYRDPFVGGMFWKMLSPALVVDDGACNSRPVADNSPSRSSVWASMAQSFTAPYPRISFGFRMQEDVVAGIPQAGQPVIYNLYHGEISPLTLLASRTVSFPAGALGFGSCRAGDVGFVEADFSGVELTVGEKYTVEVTVPTGDLPTLESRTGIGVWTSLANPYSGGRFYFPVTAANPASSNNGFFSEQDMLFRIGSAGQPIEELISALSEQVMGVGPGASLADKMALALTYYAAPDVQAACAVMTDFKLQVRAQTGKKLSTALAEELTREAQGVMDAMGCQ